jgi:uncharacterized protein (TIGR03067 family)
MAWRTVLAIVLLFSPTLADEPAGDLKKMQGDWKSMTYIAEGKKWSAKERETVRLSVKGDAGTFRLGMTTVHGTYKLDESAKPRTLDILLTSGPDKGKKKLAIYEFKGDTWRICVGPVGGKRPTAFASKSGSGTWLEEWQQVR